MKKNLDYIRGKKRDGIPISMLTAYDCAMARIENESGTDILLVGDSVGTNLLGYDSERRVTMADIVHHTGAVARSCPSAFLIADMPHGSVETVPMALSNAGQLIDAGAECVKIEGWTDSKGVIPALKSAGIPVCAHAGYNPQIHSGKPKTFAKTADEANKLLDCVLQLQNAGADILVLEKVAEEAAGIVSKKLHIPVIGIGSGRLCDGQVLVINDLLGMNPTTFRHCRRYMDFYALTSQAIRSYCSDVENRRFPGEENVWHMTEGLPQQKSPSVDNKE